MDRVDPEVRPGVGVLQRFSKPHEHLELLRRHRRKDLEDLRWKVGDRGFQQVSLYMFRDLDLVVRHVLPPLVAKAAKYQARLLGVKPEALLQARWPAFWRVREMADSPLPRIASPRSRPRHEPRRAGPPGSGLRPGRERRSPGRSGGRLARQSGEPRAAGAPRARG